ncbi:MAG: DEAD/DEAH box helicase [Bacteroidia bacterium]
MTFNDLSLMPSIIRAVNDQNYTQPTPIQQQAIPLVLEQKDVLACAQTGTGKTAAFAIPIIQHTQQNIIHSKKPRITSLILTPTRELAIQIGENIDNYSKYTDVRYTVIYGGVKQMKQVERLKKGVDILVATPGRLLDLMGQGYIRLHDIKHFVLDEADRMLDMGFIHDIKRVIEKLPNKRQSLFFSATLPPNIIELSKQILTHPVKIQVTPASSTADTVNQTLYFTNKSLKKSLLVYLIDKHDIKQLLLFVKTKHGADRIARDLKKKRINAQAIHGDKAQNQRQNALRAFKEGKINVLVATDIAARGIDIDKLEYVINYDIPNEPETYVHRIGRSGRAGESGFALSLCEPEENIFVKDIEKLIKKKIRVVDDHPYPQTDKPMTAAEKKEWNKEKQRRKQEFFANRKKSNRRN